MSEIDQSVFDKISGLLKLAEKNNNVHESAAAASAAQALLTKYRLTKADLVDNDGGEKIGQAKEPIFSGNRIIAWKSDLLMAVTRTNGCRFFLQTTGYSYSRQNRKKNINAILVGRDSDIQIVRYFFTYLTGEIERLAKAELASGNLSGKRESNSFKVGASRAVEARLYEGKKAGRIEAEKQLAAGTSQALVKLDNADAQVVKYFDSLGLKKGKARAVVNLDEYAFYAGKAAGNKIPLNKGLDGGAPKGRLC